MKISDFQNMLRTVEIPLPGGATVTARELTAADEIAIREAFPKPVPPMIKDPNRGSLSKTPNAEDPEYRAAFDAWFDRIAVMELAAAIGLELDEGKWDRSASVEHRRAWLEAAHNQLSERLPPRELDRMIGALAGLAAAAAEGVGLGNSGAGPTPTAS